MPDLKVGCKIIFWVCINKSLHLHPATGKRVYVSSGRSVARLSRLLWEQEVASSNLAAPTNG